jgi:hypothetical protein
MLRGVAPCCLVKVTKTSTNIVSAFSGSVFQNTEAGCSSETSVYIYETTWWQISKGRASSLLQPWEPQKSHVYSKELFLNFFCFCHLYVGWTKVRCFFLRLKKDNFFRVHAMKARRESRGIAPYIPKHGIRWRWVVNFTPIYALERIPVSIE